MKALAEATKGDRRRHEGTRRPRIEPTTGFFANLSSEITKTAARLCQLPKRLIGAVVDRLPPVDRI